MADGWLLHDTLFRAPCVTHLARALRLAGGVARLRGVDSGVDAGDAAAVALAVDEAAHAGALGVNSIALKIA